MKDDSDASVSDAFDQGDAGEDASTAIVDSGAGQLRITTEALPRGMPGATYTATLAASGGRPPYQWSVVGGGLPPRVELDSASGVLRGSPPTEQVRNVTLRVIDSAVPVNADDASLTLAFSGPLRITTLTLPTGVIGVAYSSTLRAQGGVPPHVWGLESGAMPPGLSLDPMTGLVSGTPTSSGGFAFTVRIVDQPNPPPQQGTSALVTLETVEIAITTPSLEAAIIDEAYFARLQASGGTPPYAWSLNTGNLPPGLMIDGVEGSIFGNPVSPPTSTSFSITVQDSSARALTTSRAFSLDSIMLTGGLLRITPTSLPAARVGVPYAETLAVDQGAAPLSWAVMYGRLPSGLSLSSSGIVAGVPGQAESVWAAISVEDDNCDMGSRWYLVEVMP